MATLQEACEYLDQALAEYSAARSMPAIETAILAMHTGLELVFRTYLQGSDSLPNDVWEALERPGGVSFPELVDLMGGYTDVLGTDPRTRALLVSLNTTRVDIAHPLHKPPEEQIVNDAWRFAELIVSLWPRLFPGGQVPYVTPVTIGTMRGGIRASPQVTLSPVHPPVSAEAKRKPSRARQRPAIFLSLWRGEAKPTRWLLRLLGGLVIGVLATLAWRAAVSLAHWPPPMKTVSVVLVIAALGLAVWSAWLLWRVFRLLGVRRVLILLIVLYLSAVSVRVLTVEDERSLLHRILPQMQCVASEAWGALASFTRSLVQAPATFRFAYTGRNPLFRVLGVRVNSTPIAGEIIEPLVYTRLDELTPTTMPAPVPTSPPSKPEVSGEIQIGSHVQVSGTGGKTLRARSGPGTSYDVVTHFEEGAQLLVLEGPVEANGYVWWKVRGGEDEGWCADRWLRPIR